MTLEEIVEIQRMIDTSPAEMLQDSAVKLRRLSAYVEKGQPAWLLAGALSAVERAAMEDVAELQQPEAVEQAQFIARLGLD